MDLAAFNSAPPEHATAALLECCSSPRWADLVAAGRPYASAQSLLAAADTALAGLSDDELAAALAGHPRIGERSGPGHAAGSGREQAGVAQSSAATRAALVEGNREYEARFGHVYLVCADGRSGDELLAILQARLDNEPATEWVTTREELGKINRLRLSRLLGEDPR
jgi:2-oxo-4-hydroxy-4-carboxy-5-ureidoimidazoline decarboxylase